MGHLIESFLFHFPRFTLSSSFPFWDKAQWWLSKPVCQDGLLPLFGKCWSGRTAFGSYFNIILWHFDQIRCWFNPWSPLKYLLHTTRWASFITHLNDLCRCSNNSNTIGNCLIPIICFSNQFSNTKNDILWILFFIYFYSFNWNI